MNLKAFLLPTIVFQLSIIFVTAVKAGENADYERFVYWQNIKEEMNIQTVRSAFEGVHQNGDSSAFEQYYSEYYVDHDPAATNGRDFVKTQYIEDRPDNLVYEIGSIMAEGDFVAVHSRITGFTESPVIAVSIVKVNGGKIMEHWTVEQTEVPAEQTVSGNSMFPIEYDLTPSRNELSTKNFVVNAMNQVIGIGNTDEINQIWAEAYIQHNPTIDNGRGAVFDIASFVNSGDLSYQLGFAMAYGDFVLLQSTYTFFGATSVAIDTFRIENGLIAEHWDLLEAEVPIADTAGGNPVFPVY
jgi:predicted SnoaL-like aldol condensation-catalyzing enzyme